MDILKKYINNIINIRQELKNVDKKQLWFYDDFPNPGIDEIKIKEFEKDMHLILPNKYRDFLKVVNGWKNFWHGVDLFSIEDFKDKELMNYTKEAIELLYIDDNSLFPIGIAKEDIDLFTIIKTGYKDEGTIIWFAGCEVERYKDFNEFLKGIYILLEDDVIDFKNDIY